MVDDMFQPKRLDAPALGTLLCFSVEVGPRHTEPASHFRALLQNVRVVLLQRLILDDLTREGIWADAITAVAAGECQRI